MTKTQWLTEYRGLLADFDQLSNEKIAQTLLARDFHFAKITSDQRVVWTEKAWQTGTEVAAWVKDQAATSGVAREEWLVSHLTLVEKKFPEKTNQSNYTFAQFQAPNRVTLNQPLLAAATAFWKSNQLLDGGFEGPFPDFSTLVLSHEFFHFYETSHPAIFTRQKCLNYRIGLFKKQVAVRSLSEIGACGFVQALWDLPFSPALLDSLLVAPQNPDLAMKLLKSYLK